jgi:hypothetical protein
MKELRYILFHSVYQKMNQKKERNTKDYKNYGETQNVNITY